MPRRVILIRHALPDVREDVDTTAWNLTPAGRIAATNLRAQVPRDAVLASSTEIKAIETLCLAADVHSDALRLDGRFGEVRRNEPFDNHHRTRRLAWVAGDLDGRHSGWETPVEAAARFQAAVTAVDDPDGNVVVATHGMVMTAWLVALGAVGSGSATASYWSALGFPAIHRVALQAGQAPQ